MKLCKRIWIGVLAVVMLVSTVPMAKLPAAQAAGTQANETALIADVEYAMFPLDELHITRSNNKSIGYRYWKDGSSHEKYFSFDFITANRSQRLKAPFTLRLISTGGNHSVIFESVNKVMLANGEVDYVTCMFTHDNNIKDLVKKDKNTNDEFVKDIIPQGTPFYDQGDYGGNSTGKHVHVEIARGRVCSKNKTFWQNWNAFHDDKVGMQAPDVFFLTSTTSTNAKKSNGLNWRILNEVTFDVNSPSAENFTKNYVVGKSFGSLPVPADRNRIFAGWFTDKTGGTQVTESTAVTNAKTTLYARWKDADAGSTGKVSWLACSAHQDNGVDAKISATAAFGWRKKLDSCGYYIGTDQNYLIKTPKPETIGRNVFLGYHMEFGLNECGQKLLPNTTYYYQCYLVIDGVEYKGPVKSFKTAETVNALNPKWSSCAARNITETNATIKGTVTYGESVSPERCGFYLGTSNNNLTKAAKYDTVTGARTYSNMSYNLTKYGQTLKAGTTYYYQFYVIVAGKEYKSPINSFKTKGTAAVAPALDPAWSSYSVADVTENNATIKVKVTYGKTVSPERCGFYLGTSDKNLVKAAKYDTVTGTRTYSNMSYNMVKYGQTLNADTTYYYQFYVVVDGKEYKSAVKSFKTDALAAQPAPVPDETPLNLAWSSYSAGSITQTDATIKVTVNYGKTVYPERCGFYLGTSSNNLTKAAKYDTVTGSRTYSNMSYNMAKYGQTLKAGTTYYYQFYVVVDGVEYTSAVKSFKTAAAAAVQTTPEAAKLNPVWSSYSANSITQTDATIKATVTYGKTVYPERCGFYLGTSSNNLTKAAKYDAITGSRTYSNMSYNMAKYGQTLKAGTTYYYQFYVVVDGVEYTSAVKSFKTAAALNPTWSSYSAESITKTDATIKVKATYGKTVYPERCGFYLGTSSNSLTKAAKYDSITGSRTYSNMSYNMAKYGQTLKAGTTYYYQFYVVVDGTEYKSAVKSFTTAS